jgi:hypothetical protein
MQNAKVKMQNENVKLSYLCSSPYEGEDRRGWIFEF